MGLQETTIFFQNIRHRHFYLCQYLPLGSGVDTVSRSLMKFKRGAQPDLDNWLDRAQRCFCSGGPALPAGTVIVRALHHKETKADPEQPCPLDRLGQSLSAQLHFSYIPGLLFKNRQTTINQGLTRRERAAELLDVYEIDQRAFPAASGRPGSFLLVDDILTTGATVLAVMKTLRAAWPGCTIAVFTLAKVA